MILLFPCPILPGAPPCPVGSSSKQISVPFLSLHLPTTAMSPCSWHETHTVSTAYRVPSAPITHFSSLFLGQLAPSHLHSAPPSHSPALPAQPASPHSPGFSYRPLSNTGSEASSDLPSLGAALPPPSIPLSHHLVGFLQQFSQAALIFKICLFLIC